MKRRTDRKPHTLRAALLAVLCLTGLFSLAFYDSGHRLVTTEYAVASARLPAAFDGLRIVQLSDLHAASFGRDNARLVKTVAAAQPDLIVLTGDFIETADEIGVSETLTRQLAQLAPVYFVSGNHDWASHAAGDLFAALESAGATCLRNEAVTLTRGAQQLLLVGVEDPNSFADLATPDEVVAQAQAAHPGLFTILIGHRNYWVTEYPALPVDVILCGHSHGGIIWLPGVGGLISEDRTLFPVYDAGRYDCGSYAMIVSRGLGQARQFPRLFNNPEVVCVVLRAEA